MTQQRFIQLLDGYQAGTLTENEQLELSQLLHDPQNRQQLGQFFAEDFSDPSFNNVADPETLELVYQQIQLKKQPAPVRRMKVYRWAAAAAIFILLASVAYLVINRNEKATYPTTIAANDIVAPTGFKAILILSNGEQIIVDSTINGPIATQGSVRITKSAEGWITYTGTASAQEMNTIMIPAGSRPVQLRLADGSKVWINAASSVTYPVAFTGAERKLQLIGEAYFEVSHIIAGGAKQSFIVEKGEMQVQVLGTHFNVKAYDDEPDTKVTLLEGSVRVADRENQVTIKPGEQASVSHISHKSQTIPVQTIDTDEVMAWKNGFFEFDQADIQSIMRQLARWYNVEVEYRGEVSKNKMSAIIDRNNNVSQVLNMLQSTGRIQFKVEGRKIIVLPE